MSKLLKNKPVLIKGLSSEKTGKTYDAYVQLEEKEGKVGYQMTFR